MMEFTRRSILVTAAGVAGSSAMAAGAQPWPVRPITVVVPQAAGNSPDVLCRMLTERLTRSLGQPLIVENRPGAANLVGTRAVTRAAPDGYTFLFATSASLVTNPFTFKNLGYDPLTELTPVAMVARSNHVLAVTSSLKVATLAELIALEKATPGSLSMAVDGPRNLSGLMARALNKYAGTKFVLVAYNNTSGAIQDTLTGRTQVTIQSTSVAEPYIEEGTLRPLAVAGSRRIAAMPNVPALSDTLPALDLQGWFMILGPAGLPAEIAEKFSTELARALADPELQKLAGKVGFELDPAGPVSPAAASVFLKKEYETSGKVVRELGIEPE